MKTSRQTDALPLRIGLFGIGLDVYWPQFRGLKDRLEGGRYGGPSSEMPDDEPSGTGRKR